MTAVLRLAFALILLLAILTGADVTASQDQLSSDHAQPSSALSAPGASIVQEALRSLDEIKPSTYRFARIDRSAGLVGRTLYYTKEIFRLLFMNGPPPQDVLSSTPAPRLLGPPLARVVDLLEEAAEVDNADAIFMLAEMNFFGNYSHPRNYPEAFRRYQQLADLNGNTTAQYMVGFMYATGVGGSVEQDQARAMLYYDFAAMAGNTKAQMVMAHRYLTGIATPKSCDTSVSWYKKVADKAMAYVRSGPPGGHQLIRESYRLADDVGGVYGEGASVVSSGINAKRGSPNSDAHAAFEDVLEYLDLMSRKGDMKATYNLAKIHYDGTREMKRDFRIAKDYFLDVARGYWSKDGKVNSDAGPLEEKLASKAAGYLGRMFLRGEGTMPNYQIAKTWFKRGILNGDALSQFHMGLMYLHGLDVPQDTDKASEFFGAAADQDLASAQVQMGRLYLDQGDVSTAIRYFELAARNHNIQGFYYLAELAEQGVGRDRNCGQAAAFYKIVSEKAEVISTSFTEANEAFGAGHLETALIAYMMAAEQGFEVAQANVAYLLDPAKPAFSFGKLVDLIPLAKKKATIPGDTALGLVYWTRSAKQGNVDSMVKMGDYYLEGVGTPPDQEKAAASYQAAADTLQSAQAMWNLGWMHENGIGMEQDFHLAKRMYDLALETNTEAYVPVKLALLKLRTRSWWNKITNGRVNSIQDEPEDKPWTFNDWLAQFLENDAAYYADDYEPDDWDSVQAHGGIPPGDDFYDELDEGLLESLVILGLAATLAFLIYYRQQRQLQQQQQNAAAANNQNPGANDANAGAQHDGGFFPPPDDPNFANWVAGGVGH